MSLPRLEYLYLANNEEVACDCGLAWLYTLKTTNHVEIDAFACAHAELGRLSFDLIESGSFLSEMCRSGEQPSMHVNTKRMEESSDIPLFRLWSKQWFAWTVFRDHVPTTTPYPFLMQQGEDR